MRFHLCISLWNEVEPTMLSAVKMWTVRVGMYHKEKDVALHAIDSVDSIPQLHYLGLEKERA